MANEFNYQDFAIPSSIIDIDLNLSMPLEFMATDLTLQSEFPVTLDAESGIEGIGNIDLTFLPIILFHLKQILTL
ncbi:MAG: hypothetical protein IPI65_06315 [Bacteroidetes bacterium]|nr:hypothetical protein [Bacteroidota bacterium]